MENLSAKSRASIEKAKSVIYNLRGYWPLTLRQIYYQLVAAQIIDNNIREYQKLSRLLSAARMEGLIRWECMEDRSRRFIDNAGWSDADNFITASYEHFLSGYNRDLMLSQPKYIEIWIEKDALSGIIDRVAAPYNIPVVVARGFASMSFKNKFIERVNDVEKDAVILYFGDFDPSGMEMLPAMLRTFDEMGADYDIEGIRCALTEIQIEDFDLPNNPDAMKDTDSRSVKFEEEYGRVSVELDALSPDVLSEIVETAIENNIDIDLLEEEKENEINDLKRIEELKEKTMKLIEGKPEKKGKKKKQ